MNALWETRAATASIARLPESEPIAQLAANIVAARHRLGITQEEVSRRCDVHPVELSRIENGQRDIRASTVVRLARALELPPGALFENIT